MRFSIILICLLITSKSFSQFEANDRFIGGDFSFFYTAKQHEFSSLNSNSLSIAAHPQYGRFLSDRWAFAFLAGVGFSRNNVLVSQDFPSFQNGEVSPIIIEQINNGNFRVSNGTRYYAQVQSDLHFRIMPSFRHYKMFSQRIGLISEIGVPTNYCITFYEDDEVSSFGVGTNRGFSQSGNFHQLNIAAIYVPRFLFMLNEKWGLEAAIGSIIVQYDLEKKGDNSFKGDRFSAKANFNQRFNIGVRYYFTPSSL